MEKKDAERKGAGRKDTRRKRTERKDIGRRATGEKGKAGTNADQDHDTSIACQNKGIVSKLFGDRMKEKPLSLFGLESDLKVVDARPTNIPIVRAMELRMDNLFELEDGSAAIFDYESEYREWNFTKYGRCIMDVIDRYLKEGKSPDIYMMVLYTADVEKAAQSMERTACTIRTETVFLTGIRGLCAGRAP